MLELLGIESLSMAGIIFVSGFIGCVFGIWLEYVFNIATRLVSRIERHKTFMKVIDTTNKLL